MNTYLYEQYHNTVKLKALIIDIFAFSVDEAYGVKNMKTYSHVSIFEMHNLVCILIFHIFSICVLNNIHYN